MFGSMTNSYLCEVLKTRRAEFEKIEYMYNFTIHREQTMFNEIVLFAAVILFAYAFYKWARLNDDYFERRNIKYVKSKFLFGNAGDILSSKYTEINCGRNLYNAFPDEP